MITLDLDLLQVRASAISRTVQTVLAGNASDSEIRPPARGVASDPLKEWLDVGPLAQVSNSALKIPLPDLEWTSDHERRFVVMAGREATGKLTLEETGDLERLSRLRRSSKNPRLGEEVVWEYEQRELTRN